MTGYGKLYYFNNSTCNYELQYIGYFKNNRFNGLGMCFHENGNKFYEGHFAKGQPCGEGILYDEDGNVKEKSYYITGKHHKDLSNTRHIKLKKKLDRLLKFPLYYIHYNT
jgi:antitoxin component YwqK of YwqJK toxin-antitoxin module